MNFGACPEPPSDRSALNDERPLGALLRTFFEDLCSMPSRSRPWLPAQRPGLTLTGALFPRSHRSLLAASGPATDRLRLHGLLAGLPAISVIWNS